MKILKNAKLNNILKYILPSLATVVIFCIVLIIKGIYPFGAATIDFYDLSDQGTPIYMHVYDAVHGHKNMFYDLYSALSTNMTGMLGTSGISPFNLYFLFIKRESVLKCMSIFILLKMMVMSLGMYLFLERAVSTEYIYKLVFSVCYGFSGYVLLHYTSHIWFDNVAYFPFVMAGLYTLIKEGKCLLYTVSMTLSVICGYYISFLFFIYIFLILGTVIIINMFIKSRNVGDSWHLTGKEPGQDCQSYHLTELLVCTVVSLLASLFILLPQINQTLSSARFTNESGGGILGMYTGILKNVTPAYTSRWFVLLNVSFSIAVIITGLIKFRQDVRLMVFTIVSAVILCAGLIFENINLIWHYGSYVHYPIRNGFMITFIFSYIACLYIEKINSGAANTGDGTETSIGAKTSLNSTESSVSIKTSPNKISTAVTVIFSCICIAATAAIMYIYSKNPGLSQRTILHILGIVMAVCAIVYVVLIVFKNARYMKLAPVLVVCELILYGFIFFGKPTYITGYTEDPEMERDSYYVCNRLYEALDLEDSTVNRIKNPDESLNSNYALVLRRSALSNWTALISPKLQESAERLGYTVQYTRLLDSGGTVFSDALLGIKNIITCVPQDEKLYELIDTADIIVDNETGRTDKYYYYKCKYELPWGIRLNSRDNIDFNEGDIVKLYNSIYLSMTDETTNIAEYIDVTPENNDGGFTVNKTIAARGKKALYYLAAQVDTDDYNTSFTVNGKDIIIPSISEKDNTLFPAHFNNNAVYLGSFENETADLCITFSDTDKNGNPVESQFIPRVISIDLDMLDKLCKEYSGYDPVKGTGRTSYSLECSLDRDGYIMLPLSYDKGYTAKVNGRKEDIEFLGGLFMTVPVHGGTNSIEIHFSPRGFKTGMVISVITVIVAGLIYFWRHGRQKQIIFEGILQKIYIFAWFAVVLVMYVIPVIYALFSKVSG